MLEALGVAILSSALTVAVLVFVGKGWFEARVKASIEHEYKKQFEVFSRDLDRKEKVELVADLMAEFLKVPKGERLDREQRLLLTRLSFRASLWLPGELAIELSKRLQNGPDAKSPFEILLMARKLLIGDESLGVEHITHWEPALEVRGDPLLIHEQQSGPKA
jgi:hypothetical protein